MTQADSMLREVIRKILSQGRWYTDKSRENTHRLQIPRVVYNFSGDEFAAMTLRELKFNSVITELVWFLRGDTNIKYLVDNNNPIWNKDAYNWYKKVCRENGLYRITYKSFIDAIKSNKTMKDLCLVHGGMLPEHVDYTLGDVGKNYSKQWRDYGGKVDQIIELVKTMKSNIMSTRLKVEAWNPAETKDTALPPCHTGFQIVGQPLTTSEQFDLSGLTDDEFHEAVEAGLEEEFLEGTPTHGFYLYWNQRSVDVFLGLPFNIASYNLLGLFLEAVTGHKFLGFGPDLRCVHLYDNSIEAAKKLLKIESNHKAPKVSIDLGDLKDKPLEEIFNNISKENFVVENYTSEEAFSVEMKAPKDI